MAFLEHFVTETLGLARFPPYLATFYWSFIGFTVIHLIVAPYFSNRCFPVSYAGKARAARNNWSIHVVSQVHALIIVPYALWCILNETPGQDQDRAFGWEARVGYVHAIATAYFLWDSLDAIVNFIDSGFVAHGIVCFAIYAMSYKPFVAYYATRCLLWETSTIFLNNHWFLDKTNRTGSRLQLVNGCFLLASFFAVRLVYGGSVSIQFLLTLREVYHEIPFGYALVYGLGNVLLQGLNWFWFFKMISALRKRFSGLGERTKLIEDQTPGNIVINGSLYPTNA